VSCNVLLQSCRRLVLAQVSGRKRGLFDVPSGGVLWRKRHVDVRASLWTAAGVSVVEYELAGASEQAGDSVGPADELCSERGERERKTQRSKIVQMPRAARTALSAERGCSVPFSDVRSSGEARLASVEGGEGKNRRVAPCRLFVVAGVSGPPSPRCAVWGYHNVRSTATSRQTAPQVKQRRSSTRFPLHQLKGPRLDLLPRP
jgi:hypothetical protein